MKKQFRVIKNKSLYEYAIESQIEVGMVLNGKEVKHIRINSISISEAYVYISKGELWLKNMFPRDIKLLLHKNQINKLIGTYEKKSYIIVPTELYELNGNFKIKIGLGIKMKQYEQKEKLKKRDSMREKRFYGID